MKIITIESKTHGAHEVQVDDEDYEELSKYKWYVIKSGDTFYAERKNFNRRNIKMHRIVIGLDFGNKLVADHIDHDGLNNQKNNLRICSQTDNKRNRKIDNAQTLNSTSNYKGVHWRKNGGKWCASIRFDRKLIHIGMFTDEKDAARAYNVAAVKYHGEFACLNVIED